MATATLHLIVLWCTHIVILQLRLLDFLISISPGCCSSFNHTSAPLLPGAIPRHLHPVAGLAYPSSQQPHTQIFPLLPYHYLFLEGAFTSLSSTFKPSFLSATLDLFFQRLSLESRLPDGASSYFFQSCESSSPLAVPLSRLFLQTRLQSPSACASSHPSDVYIFSHQAANSFHQRQPAASQPAAWNRETCNCRSQTWSPARSS